MFFCTRSARQRALRVDARRERLARTPEHSDRRLSLTPGGVRVRACSGALALSVLCIELRRAACEKHEA